MVELYDLWSLWLKGTVSPNHYLWGVSIFWWGRIGKIIEVFAGLAIIAEIIGPERLRQTGKRLRSLINYKEGFHNILQIFKSIFFLIITAFLFFLFFFSDKNPWEAYLDKFSETKIGKITLATFLVLILLIFILTWYYSGLGNAFLCILIFSLVGCFFLGIIFSIIFLFITILLISIDLLFFEPLSFLLEREKIGEIIKVGSFTIFLVGFHFDLLAS